MREQASKNQTWADMVSQSTHQVNELISQCTAVRVWLSDSQSKSLTELLSKVKPLIAETYMMKQLWSRDIKVIISDQCTKNWVLNQSQINELKILCQHYSVKLWEVSLFMQIDSKKNANNTAHAQDICAVIKTIILTFIINKICWLHALKKHETCIQTGKTRETIIISLSTQALQHEVI